MTRRRVIGAVALVVAAVVLLTWHDKVVVEDRLGAAREALLTSQAELAERDLESARTALLQARLAAQAVPDRLDGPVWTAVGWLPPVGDAPELALAAAELVHTGADLGLAAVDDAEAVLGGDALAQLVRPGGIDIDQLQGIVERVDALPVEPVAAATERLRATDPDRITDGLRLERAAAIELADELLAQFATAQAALEAGLEVLGADGPRTYLVAAQNPAELRGTGGLIGYLTEVTFDDGDIRIGQGAGFDAQTALRRTNLEDSTPDLPPPVERPDLFAERYDHAAGGQFFGSVNLDPDLPTVGPVLLRLYEQQTRGTADGVLLLDPIALGRIVAVTGEPLELPAGIETGSLPRTIPGEQIAELIMIDGYDVLGGGTEEKRAFDEAVIDAALTRLVGGGWDATAMLDELGELLDERHLQAWSTTEATQQTLVTTGAAGLLTRPEPGQDLLALTANNAAANKADAHVEHRITARIALEDAGGEGLASADGAVVRRDAEVEVAVANPLRPDDHDEYITASDELVPFGSGAPERTRNALVRTWFSVWTPGSTRPTSATDLVNGRALRVDEIHAHRVYDYYLATPSTETTAFGVGYTSPVQLVRRGDEVVYELHLWRQGKAIVDQWDLEVAAPSGWTVREATVEGGGEPTGLGPRAAGAQQLSAIVTDEGAARLEGAAVADAVLRVVMTPNPDTA